MLLSMAPTDDRLQEHTDRASRSRPASLSPSAGASSLAPPKKKKCNPPSSMEIIGAITPPSPMDSMDAFESVTPPPTSINPFISDTRSGMDSFASPNPLSSMETPPTSINPFTSDTPSAVDLIMSPNPLSSMEGFRSVTPLASTKAIGSAAPPLLMYDFYPLTPPWYSSPNSRVLSSVAPNESSWIDCLQEHEDRIMRSRAVSVSPSARDFSLIPPRKRKCYKGAPDENAAQFEDSLNFGSLMGSSKKSASEGIAYQVGASSDLWARLWEVKKPLGDETSGLSSILRRTDLGEMTNKGSEQKLISGEFTDNGTNMNFGQNTRRTVLKDVANVLSDGVLRCPSFPVQKAQTKAFAKDNFDICKAKEIPTKALSLANYNSTELKDPEKMKEDDKGPGSEGGGTVVLPFRGLTISTYSEGDTMIPGTINIDGDRSNTQMCSLYASVIYSHHRANELIRRPSSDFLETMQSNILQSMRAGLIDWLVCVCDAYCLAADTLYLTVYLIDQYLSKAKIDQEQLQLLGITCLLISSKYEESCAPRLGELHLNCSSYSKAEVLRMENKVLSSVGYHISVPTVKTFLRRFLRAAEASSKAADALKPLANYLAELTLVEYSFVKFLPSMVASCAVFLALWTLDQSKHPWNETLQYYSGYKSAEMKSTVLALQKLQNAKTSKPKHIYQKYQQEEFGAVASLESPALDSIFDHDI